MNNLKIGLFGLLLVFFGVAFSQTSDLGNWWSTPSSNVNINSSNSVSTGSNLPLNNIVANNPVSVSSSVGLLPQDDKNSNYIRDDVDSVISKMVSQYGLSPAQKSALDQVARSYQYILTTAPSNSTSAYQAGLREAASTNCASSRIPENLMDTTFAQIESATVNTSERKTVYNKYISSLQEGQIQNTPNSSQSCEDQYNSSNPVIPTNPIGPTNPPEGVIGLDMPCLILNRFMEKGASGAQVSSLQTFLVLTGDLVVWPTGYFGPNTVNAVKAFQNRYGIDSRYAWVGPSTRAKIADITCNGDPNAIAQARKGYTVTTAPVKKVITPAKPVTTPTKPVVIPTTTPVATTPVTPTDTTTILSSSSGTFDLTKNPVNSLYFTVKTNLSTETLYICMEKEAQSTCYVSTAYEQVNTKHGPTSYDSISNIDKWIFNIYYNSNFWGKTGGKIYVKKGVNGIPSTYNVFVKS